MPGALITKKALAHAMRTLMQEEAFRRISVGDICERCGMSRKSFYYHFRDKYELVNWIFDQDFIALVRDRSYDNAWEFFEDLCTYFYENRTFYVNRDFGHNRAYNTSRNLRCVYIIYGKNCRQRRRTA